MSVSDSITSPRSAVPKTFDAQGFAAAARLCVWTLYILSVYRGVQMVLSQDNYVLDMAITFASVLFVTLWAVWDSNALGKPMLSVVRMIFFLTWPIALWIHAYRTRGWKGVGWVLTHAIGMYLTAVATSMAVYSLMVAIYPD